MNNWDYYYFGDAPQHLSWVTLDKSSITLTTPWQTEYLNATIIPEDPVEDVTLNWSSSDTSIATVSPYTPRLPSEYQEVEYIESSGTQYVDTLLNANQNTIVEAKWSLTQYNGNYDKMYWGYWANDSNTFFMQSNRPYNNKFRIVNYSNTNTNRKYVDSSADLVLWQTYETKHTNTEFYIDWTLQWTCAATTYTSWYSVTIFALHSWTNTVMQNVYMKLYYFKMYDWTTLVRDLVPCYRKADDVIWLYDLVNDVFYTNSWTWDFTKWQNIWWDAIVTCVTPWEATITVTTTPWSYTATCDVDDWKRLPTSTTIWYWELNWNWEDTKNDYWITTYTTTDYDATGYLWSGYPTYVAWRKWKQCAYFDGTSTLQLPVLPVPWNTITMSVWVKITQVNDCSFIQQRQDVWSSYGWWLFMGSNSSQKLTCSWVWTNGYTSSSGATWYSFTDVDYTLGEWYNMVFTFSWWTAKLYINWVLQQTMSGRSWLRNTNSTLSFIGGTDAARANVYMQDVIYDNRTWSDQDVADYYNNSI